MKLSSFKIQQASLYQTLWKFQVFIEWKKKTYDKVPEIYKYINKNSLIINSKLLSVRKNNSLTLCYLYGPKWCRVNEVINLNFTYTRKHNGDYIEITKYHGRSSIHTICMTQCD